MSAPSSISRRVKLWQCGSVLLCVYLRVALHAHCDFACNLTSIFQAFGSTAKSESGTQATFSRIFVALVMP